MATDLKGLNNFRNKLQKFSKVNSNFITEVADEIAIRGEQIAMSEYAGVEGVSLGIFSGALSYGIIYFAYDYIVN